MDDDVRWALTQTRTWAVVGCSPDPGRDSHRIAALLQRRGFRMIPVNPAVSEVLGERCYGSLGEIDTPERNIMTIDEAIAIGARGVWLQLGVIDEAAVGRAREAGLRAVMDRCPAIELPKLDAAA